MSEDAVCLDLRTLFVNVLFILFTDSSVSEDAVYSKRPKSFDYSASVPVSVPMWKMAAASKKSFEEEEDEEEFVSSILMKELYIHNNRCRLDSTVYVLYSFAATINRFYVKFLICNNQPYI